MLSVNNRNSTEKSKSCCTNENQLLMSVTYNIPKTRRTSPRHRAAKPHQYLFCKAIKCDTTEKPICPKKGACRILALEYKCSSTGWKPEKDSISNENRFETSIFLDRPIFLEVKHDVDPKHSLALFKFRDQHVTT